MVSILLPALVTSFVQSAGLGAPPVELPLGSEVPLSYDPMGFSGTNGAVWLDYDADGWPDLFCYTRGELWRNQEGAGLAQVASLIGIIPPGARYGASAADYDCDGFPDIAGEPRGTCFGLLRALDGNGSYAEVAADPTVVLDAPRCGMWAETFCWADVDEDGDVDLWAPAYVGPPESGGNHFFENLGPTGPGGAFRLAHRPDAAGLDNRYHITKPEGAQFVDLDRDGDVDGMANGTYYRNDSAPGSPSFQPLRGPALGLQFAGNTDEGLLFFDYDLDGDQDLLLLHAADKNRLYENEGDGTFLLTSGVVQQPMTGAATGCSAEDWDLDGDVDLTTTHTFRRNMRVETGERSLRIVTAPFTTGALSPAWADWDRDGDPDCVMSAWAGGGDVCRNSTYGPDTPGAAKLTVRVRAVRDSAVVARGLENEFGATVELRPHADASGFVRRRFVASSHGYLQQSEYALTMALPPGPDPDAPALGVVFDLLVDFPSLPENGILRVDGAINTALGGIALSALADREITVWRSGKVRIDGVEFPPRTRFSPRLRSTGGLATPEDGAVPAEPVAAPARPWFVGLELDTRGAPGPTRIAELVLDGQLETTSERCGANVQLWDVTLGAPTRSVAAESHATSLHNDRSFLPVDWTLAPDRLYRVLCRVTALRASPRVRVPPGGTLNVRGGLSFANPDPCQPFDPLAASADPTRAFLELRYRTPELPSSR